MDLEGLRLEVEKRLLVASGGQTKKFAGELVGGQQVVPENREGRSENLATEWSSRGGSGRHIKSTKPGRTCGCLLQCCSRQRHRVGLVEHQSRRVELGLLNWWSLKSDDFGFKEETNAVIACRSWFTGMEV